MGTLQNYHESLTLRATWAAMIAYLNGRRYGSHMPDAEAARKVYTWVENGVEQTSRPKVIAPLFQLAVRTDDPVWEKFCNNSVTLQSLLCLANGQWAALTHWVNHQKEIPHAVSPELVPISEAELNNAKENDDEEKDDSSASPKNLQRPNPDIPREQAIC